MKKIEAIIKQETLDAVKDALTEAGVVGMTVCPVKGRGTGGGIRLQWRAGTYRVDFLPKVLVMIVVEDDQVDRIVDIIVNVCNHDVTGGAGKIFVTAVEQVIRIRTNERGASAI